MHTSLKNRVQTLLQSNDISPEKVLGQNFLVDESVAQKIVHATRQQNASVVVEVGTGLGTLTERIAQGAQEVISVEKSASMHNIARKLLQQYPNIQLVRDDILQYAPPLREYALVGAPPYYLTTRLLRTFLQDAKNPPTAMILLIQKQVAQKIIQTPPHSSLLSVAVQVYGTPRIECIVPQNAFVPQPKVQSALLVVENIHKPDIDETMLFEVIRQGFAHPRKTLLNNLSQYNAVRAVLTRHAIHLNARPQTLTPNQWIDLATALCIKE